jgi:hypothetical protein
VLRHEEIVVIKRPRKVGEPENHRCIAAAGELLQEKRIERLVDGIQ